MRSLDHSRLLVEPGHRVNLADFDPGATDGFKDKDDAKATFRSDLQRLAELQEIFYAQAGYALLVILQGMDAAGKDGVIKHVMSGVNPQGVDVTSFKTPSTEELAHDYLWRCSKALPERGRIGIFNRSYYEELAVVRVHPELLERERLPPAAPGSDVWTDRFADIAAFEHHLARNGTLILKFFLHISNDEQRKRLLARIDTPAKNWKLSPADLRERAFWETYQEAYGELLTHTSTAWAPWYIIPANKKWFTRLAVASVIVERLASLGLTYPRVTDEQRAQLLLEREQLTEPAPNAT